MYKKLKMLTIYVAMAILIPNSVWAKGELTVSSIEIGGNCELYDNRIGADASAESLSSALLTSIGTKLVSEGVGYISKWLTNYKDRLNGSDSTSTVSAFFCKEKDKNDLDQHGHFSTVSYSRKELHAEGSTNNSTKTHIELVSKINFFKVGDNPENGVYSLSLEEITYNKPVAKSGSIKDIAVTYVFSIMDKNGKFEDRAVGPFLIKGAKKGSKYTGLEVIGSKLIGKIPMAKSAPPVQISIQIAETGVGKGEKLAAVIAEKIGESISAEKESINKAILAKIGISDNSTPTPNPDAAKK